MPRCLRCSAISFTPVMWRSHLEEGDLGIAQVARHRPDDLEVGLLEHVGRVHTAVKAAVEAHLDHPVQAVPVFHELAAQGLLVRRSHRPGRVPAEASGS